MPNNGRAHERAARRHRRSVDEYGVYAVLDETDSVTGDRLSSLRGHGLSSLAAMNGALVDRFVTLLESHDQNITS